MFSCRDEIGRRQIEVDPVFRWDVLTSSDEADGNRWGVHEFREGRHQPSGEAKRNRLRRMPGLGRVVVASSQMRPMRPHWVLRQLAQSARFETQRRHGSSGNRELRARRRVVLRLSYSGILRRPETSRSSFPSAGSTGARTGWCSPLELANAAS